MDIDEFTKAVEENFSDHTETDFRKLFEPRSLPPTPRPNVSELFNPEEIVQRIDALAQSGKTIEERLDKLRNPRWQFWLPIIISTTISILAIIIALLGWRRPAVQAPASFDQTRPSMQSIASPTQSPPIQGSHPK